MPYNDITSLEERFYSLVIGESDVKIDELREILIETKHPIITISANMKALNIFFKGRLKELRETTEEDIEQMDLFLSHGFAIDETGLKLAEVAKNNNLPMVFVEDGFLRSIVPWNHPVTKDVYKQPYSLLFDYKTLYFNSEVPSLIEKILESDIDISAEMIKRASIIIDKIKDKCLSKYNHQKKTNILLPLGRKRILVIDQVMGDKSITFGGVDDSIFLNMLQSAINENEDAAILIKTHPDARKGHFENVKETENVFLIQDERNPVELLSQIDEVYVCTSQMGFEAMMCGKKVHIFGKPFYAGWGQSDDRMVFERRTKKRSIEEIFYIAYITCSVYVSYKRNKVCEIEEAMEELLELRDGYQNECYS